METKPQNSVLITGAARRIGAKMAQALASDGWFVYIHCNTSANEASELLKKIRSSEGNGEIVIADLAKPADINRIFRKISETGNPPLRVLVNNASLFEYDDVVSMTPKMLDDHFAVNLRAPMLLSQIFYNLVPHDQKGCIVNILDNKVLALNPDYLSYTLSKIGLYGATTALAMAMAPKIRVNAIAPGITLESGNQGQENFQKARTVSPLGHVSCISDIINALRFILSTKSLNGHVIAIDGGQSLQKLPRDVAFLNTPSQ